MAKATKRRTRPSVAVFTQIAESLRPLATPVNAVRFDPKNARLHPDRNIESIKASLARYGQRKPVVANRTMGIIEAGNATWEAVQALGWTHLAVVYVEDDPTTAVGYAIADNRTAELAEWDEKALVEMLKTLQVAGELPNVGFDEDELRRLILSLDGIQGDGFDPQAALDANPELATKVQRGQVWRLGRHRLMCGDSTQASDVTRLMNGAQAHAVVTDPPYGIGREGIANDEEAGLAVLYAGVLAVLPVTDAVVVAFQSPRLFPAWIDAVRAAGHVFHRALFMYKPDDETFPWRG